MDLTVTTSAEGDLLGCNSLLYQGSPLPISALSAKIVNQTGNSASQTTTFAGTLTCTGDLVITGNVDAGTLTSPTGSLSTGSTIGSTKSVTIQNSLSQQNGSLYQWKSNMANNTTLQMQLGATATSNAAGAITYSHMGDGNAANELQWSVYNYGKMMGLTPSTLSFPQGLQVNSETVLPTISTNPLTISYSADPTITNSLTLAAATTSHREITINFALELSGTSSPGRVTLQVGNTATWATLYEGFTSGNYSYSQTVSMNNYLTWTGLGVQLTTDSIKAGCKLLGSARFYRLNTTTNMYLCWVQVSCPDTQLTTVGYAKTMWASGMGTVTLDVIQRARLVSTTGSQVSSTSVWNPVYA